MTIIEAIRDYFNSCPLLQGGRINVNYLPSDKQEYTITPTPGEHLVKRYIGGGGVYQFPFVFGMSAWLDANAQQAIDNSGFFEHMAEWITEQSNARNLPQLPDEMTAQKLTIITSGYAHAIDRNGMAKYQMQLNLIYVR